MKKIIVLMLCGVLLAGSVDIAVFTNDDIRSQILANKEDIPRVA